MARWKTRDKIACSKISGRFASSRLPFTGLIPACSVFRSRRSATVKETEKRFDAMEKACCNGPCWALKSLADGSLRQPTWSALGNARMMDRSSTMANARSGKWRKGTIYLLFAPCLFYRYVSYTVVQSTVHTSHYSLMKSHRVSTVI